MQSTDTEIRDLLLGLDKKIDALDKKVEVNAARSEEQLKRIEQRIDAVDAKLNQRIDAMDTKLSQQIGSLDKKVDSLETRINAQDLRFWGLIGIMFTALLGVLAKLAFFPTPSV